MVEPTAPDDDETLEPAQFEEMVAALLQVDPEGITGQRAAKKDPPPKPKK